MTKKTKTKSDLILNVNEIFYSLQGEGARTGSPTIFIRLSGCSLKNACLKHGVICDTQFESGTEISIRQIHEKIKNDFPQCAKILWTGGEPLDQLDSDHVKFFQDHGYFQAIETSGIKPIPFGLDYVCISPKIAEHAMKKIHGFLSVEELRYVIHAGQPIPSPSINAEYLYLSPHSDGDQINFANLNHCIELIKQNPEWRLSIQTHKLIKIR